MQVIPNLPLSYTSDAGDNTPVSESPTEEVSEDTTEETAEETSEETTEETSEETTEKNSEEFEVVEYEYSVVVDNTEVLAELQKTNHSLSVLNSFMFIFSICILIFIVSRILNIAFRNI